MPTATSHPGLAWQEKKLIVIVAYWPQVSTCFAFWGTFLLTTVVESDHELPYPFRPYLWPFSSDCSLHWGVSAWRAITLGDGYFFIFSGRMLCMRSNTKINCSERLPFNKHSPTLGRRSFHSKATSLAAPAINQFAAQYIKSHRPKALLNVHIIQQNWKSCDLRDVHCGLGVGDGLV